MMAGLIQTLGGMSFICIGVTVSAAAVFLCWMFLQVGRYFCERARGLKEERINRIRGIRRP
ncbi:MAG: hypothetical protein NVV63_12660 [Opitutus sp.]|nr:hypothetical protein [Opitutus sp.]